MFVTRSGLLSLTAAVALAAGLATPAAAADRSDVYRPINCNNADIPCIDVGDSRLQRSAEGLVASVATSRLRKGHAYSVWWVAFNSPENCAARPCSLDDLENEDAGGTAIWATGFVAGDFGTGSQASGQFTAILNKGETPAGGEVAFENVEGADVLLVIRSHGRAQKDLVGEQITSFDAGCDSDVTPAVPKAAGECANVQFAVHMAEP